jgi:hypothetical protein
MAIKTSTPRVEANVSAAETACFFSVSVFMVVFFIYVATDRCAKRRAKCVRCVGAVVFAAIDPVGRSHVRARALTDGIAVFGLLHNPASKFRQ